MSSAASTETFQIPLERFAGLVPYLDRPLPLPMWTESFDNEAYRATLEALAPSKSESLSLYIHVPFCAGRCLYCGCNTTVTHDSRRIDRYLDLLEREMAMVSGLVGGDRDLLQAHLAGGTPNYLTEAQLGRLSEMVERHFRLLADTDRSIECDPRRTSAGQLELLHALGFQRITLGVQDLEPQVQRAIGRIQSRELIQDVYWLAREIGFESIGFDLIYGLPLQTAEGFQRTLDAVVELSPDRIACFGYSRSTAAGSPQHAIDPGELPSAEARQQLFRSAVETFTANGYAWIGLDAFVLSTDELAIAQEEKRLQRNCIGYTVKPSDHMIPLGTGAVGEVDGACVQNDFLLESWQARVERGELPVARGHRLSRTDRRRREALSHMICNLELPADLAADCLEDEYSRLAGYEPDGLVEVDARGLRITPEGRYFLRALCTENDAYFHWDRARWHFAGSD
ncbi:MAG: oxygen-independent coproporphyrinogen III oxidase [Thiohalocapsa sp.]|jgi:oxygen-independent coproporphyrinogen-3 oxidase